MRPRHVVLAVLAVGLIAVAWFGVRAWLDREVMLSRSQQAEWSRVARDLARRCTTPYQRSGAGSSADPGIDRDTTALIEFAAHNRHGEFPDPLGGGGTIGHPADALSNIALTVVSCGRADVDARLLRAARAMGAWSPPVSPRVLATFVGAWNDLQARCTAAQSGRPADPRAVGRDVDAMIRSNALSGPHGGRLFKLANMESVPTAFGPTVAVVQPLGACGNRKAIVRFSEAVHMPSDDLMYGGTPPQA